MKLIVRSLLTSLVILVAFALAKEPPVATNRPKLPPKNSPNLDTQAAMREHLRELRKKLPSKDFTIVEAGSFVVVGDETPQIVKSRTEQTILWAVKKLKKSYFTQDPPQIIDIWLFKDKESYDKNAAALFGKIPDTPFGFYSSEHKALVMNISTGGGTLVHELVHPFMAVNFPSCPSWFNEGLASLYEQSGEENDDIHGYTNWRLAGLQKAIRNNKLPSFQTLCSTTTDEFYNQDKGTNYAQARYLCYYLQQAGLLKAYYAKFLANSAKDPSGYQTLQEILKQKDMAQFQKQWEEWVLELRFRG